MSKSFLFILVLLMAGGVGGYLYIHRDDNRLRMDNLQLRGEKSGLVSDGSTLSSGETVRLVLSLRGCKADDRQMCKAQVKARVEGGDAKFIGYKRGPDGRAESIDLNTMPPFEFRKNSAITSMEVQAEALGFQPGNYTVTVAAEDLVGKKTVEQKFKFSVKP